MYIYQGKWPYHTRANPDMDYELFIVVLPFGRPRLNDPIHLYWQWRNFNGSSKLNHVGRSFISATDGFDQFSCVHEVESFGSWTFEFTAKHNYGNLSIRVKYDSLVRDLELTQIYQKDIRRGPVGQPRPRIWVGKLNWQSSLENELSVIILPEGLTADGPVCAIQQWTKAPNGNSKVGLYTIDTQHRDSGPANKFYFKVQRDYTFTCEMHESSEHLTVTMSGPAGKSEAQSPAPPLEIHNTSSDSDGNRRKRVLQDYTIQIQNDLDEVVMCSFSPRESSSEGKLKAVGGFGLAVAGLIPRVVTSPVTILDWAVTVSSTVAAVRGVIDAGVAADDPAVRPLFPKDIISNRSSTGFVHSAESIFIMRMFVENDGMEFTIRKGKADTVGKDIDWNLASSVDKDDEDEIEGPNWETCFRLTLPKPKHLVSYRGLHMRNLEPAWDAKSSPKDDASPTDYALSIEEDGSNLKYYGLKLPTATGRTLFRYSTNTRFVITQSAEQAYNKEDVGEFGVLPLDNGHILVCIPYAKVSSDIEVGHWRVDEARTKEDVKRLVARNPDGWAYVHNPRKRQLITYQKPSNRLHGKVQGTAQDVRTYFLVPALYVTTTQLLVDGAPEEDEEGEDEDEDEEEDEEEEEEEENSS